jgi:hypothetical protein
MTHHYPGSVSIVACIPGDALAFSP